MSHNLYITAMESGAGKSVVALGLMETLAGRSRSAGFFRPIVTASDGRDHDIELMRRRYGLQSSPEEMFAMTAEEAHRLIATGRHGELEERVFEAYKRLESRYEVIVCEGTDFNGLLPALDFDLNAGFARQLGCPVLLVVRGASVAGIASAVRVARATLSQLGCALFGVIVNRVPAELLAEMRAHSVAYDPGEPIYVVAESPVLGCATVAQVASELGAEVLVGGAVQLQREIREVRVAAMSVEHFLEDLVDGTLVIVPADRADIVLASRLASSLTSLPSVACVMLTGGYPLAPPVEMVVQDAPFAVLRVSARTYPTAAAVHAIVPSITVHDESKIATAIGAFEAAVDGRELAERVALPRPPTRTPLMFQYDLLERAREQRRHVVLPEGEDERILRAAEILLRRGVVELTLLGTPEAVGARAAALGLTVDGAHLVDPASHPRLHEFAELYHELRRHRGVTAEMALDTVLDVNYFGALMVSTGAVDGMVSGAAHTTADTIRPAFEIIRSRPEVSVVSSVFFMCLADRVLVYGDCAVNPSPNSEQLADIAISSADTAAAFGLEVRVAMLSYSTGASGIGEQVETVRRATALARERRPELMIEGPIQYDAAVDAEVARVKLPGGEVAGRATVFVFPDLDTGNVAYKAVQRSAGAVAVGPVLQGLRRPVNDLSRGCTVPDIVNTVAITAVQAQTAAGA